MPTVRASRLLAGLAVVCACGPRPPTIPPSPAPAPAATCERLAAHLVEMLEAELAAAGLSPKAARAQRHALVRECIEHADVARIACMLAAGSLDEAARCEA